MPAFRHLGGRGEFQDSMGRNLEPSFDQFGAWRMPLHLSRSSTTHAAIGVKMPGFLGARQKFFDVAYSNLGSAWAFCLSDVRCGKVSYRRVSIPTDDCAPLRQREKIAADAAAIIDNGSGWLQPRSLVAGNPTVGRLLQAKIGEEQAVGDGTEFSGCTPAQGNLVDNQSGFLAAEYFAQSSQ